MKYAFISEQKRQHPVTMLCRVLKLSPQGYYAWRSRGVSKRKQSDEKLSARVRVLYADSFRSYGSPRIHSTLKDEGIRCGKKRVERLMRQEGLRAKAARKFRVTTDSSHQKLIAPDLLERNFTAAAPNRVWVSDITYLWTAEGWLYLAVFIDLFSRRVVGWKTAPRLHSSLVTGAFEHAVVRRRPRNGLVVHSDQGSQYASEAFRRALRKAGSVQSMGSRGDCYDNAVAESFFHSLKIEAIYENPLDTRREMQYLLFHYIERFYNSKRKHSSLGMRSPTQFESHMNIKQQTAA